jgi:hypothetical protein
MSVLKNRWLAEIGYIVVGCAVVWSSLWLYGQWDRYEKSREVALPTKPLVQNGSSLSIQGVDFAQAPMSLIVVSSPVCKYCLASEHFHSKMLEIARAANVPVYVAVPSRKGSSQYLKELAVSDDAVKEYHQMSVSVSGTPTILAIDNTGRVRDIWSGLANPADEVEIVDLLRTRSFSAGKEYTRIDAPDFQPQELIGLESKMQLDIVDLREREKANPVSGSINIPSMELPFRASRELDKAKLQVVDCTNVLHVECSSAVKTLKELRFNTATLGAGTYHLRCKATPVV